uniref:Putative secreted protein n=1 Tax=Ixodes ricinus TaxID=34613 RepID=A0A6B0U5A8_IXORI
MWFMIWVLFSTDISEVSSSLTSLSTWRMVVSASTSRSRGLLLGCLPVSPSTLAVTRASSSQPSTSSWSSFSIIVVCFR